MPHPRVSSEEIDKRGQDWYDNSIRAKVETPENIGNRIVIDIETGEYVVDDDGLNVSLRMLDKHPDVPLLGLRIGYNAVFALGGTLRRTAPL